MNMKHIVLLALLCPVPACVPETCNPIKWGYAVAHGLTYPITPAAAASPEGIRMDLSGQAVEPSLIDRLTDEVSTCLGVSIDRSTFIVKVPSDWVKSCDGTQQVLTAIAPEAGCTAKGLPTDSPCPCRWRAVIQCPNVIVATPSLYLYKDALVRWVTGSQNPWADPALAKCVAPSTAPLLSGG